MATANFKSANTVIRCQTVRPGFTGFGRSWRKRRDNTGEIVLIADGRSHEILVNVIEVCSSNMRDPAVALIVRPALASDAQSIGNLARQFASYLRELGDLTDFKLTAKAYLRDGFGTKPTFAGLVAEDQGKVIGYLLYQYCYDSDRAARNMHV